MFILDTVYPRSSKAAPKRLTNIPCFGLVLYRDYPPLHQSWKDLVLCGLITPKMCLKSTFSKLFINKGYFGRNLSNMNVLSCLVTQRKNDGSHFSALFRCQIRSTFTRPKQPRCLSFTLFLLCSVNFTSSLCLFLGREQFVISSDLI